jgi:hypothetical protein
MDHDERRRFAQGARVAVGGEDLLRGANLAPGVDGKRSVFHGYFGSARNAATSGFAAAMR